MIYGETYTVRWHDTDDENEVRPARMLEYMQETCNLQFLAAGHPLNEMHRDDHMGFLLSRIALSFDRPVHAYEEIRVETFAAESRGVSYGRCFRVMRGGEQVACATSTWALARTDTHEMIRVSDCPVDLGAEPMLDCPVPLRFRIPQDAALSEVGGRTVWYSDRDFNRHMNNTRYPDMLCDFLPDLSAFRVRGMAISFLHEAAAGATLRIFSARDTEDPDRYWFRTLREDGQINIEASVTLERRDA